MTETQIRTLCLPAELMDIYAALKVVMKLVYFTRRLAFVQSQGMITVRVRVRKQQCALDTVTPEQNLLQENQCSSTAYWNDNSYNQISHAWQVLHVCECVSYPSLRRGWCLLYMRSMLLCRFSRAVWACFRCSRSSWSWLRSCSCWKSQNERWLMTSTTTWENDKLTGRGARNTWRQVQVCTLYRTKVW